MVFRTVLRFACGYALVPNCQDVSYLKSNAFLQMPFAFELSGADRFDEVAKPSLYKA